MLASGSTSLTIPVSRTQMLGADNRQVSATARRYRARSKQMLRNRSGRLMAIMFAGSFVLAGAGGCIGGEEDAETDRDGTAGDEGTGRGATGRDDRSGGQAGEEGARGARRSGGQRGGEHAGGRQGGRGQAGQQGGRQGGEQAGGQRAGGAQACGEQAGYQGGRQGGREQAGQQGGRQGGREQAGQQGAMQQPSEAEITMLVALIHQKEVELSEFARGKAESPEVQRYAEQIIEEHSQARQRGAEMSKGGRFNIEACSRCQQLEASSTELSESLEEQEGAEFDISFIWAQVSFHRRALELLDMPSTASMDNARLRSHVKAMRADVEQHLREAEQLFCSLLQQEQQRGGQQQRAQHGQQGVQQQGPQKQAQQQRAQQQGAQYGQQGVQQQGQQQRAQQQGAQYGQQSVQQQGQQQGAQLGQQGVQQQGQQQRGQQQGAQQQEAQIGQQQRGQQQGSQVYAQQQGSQQDQQQGEPQKIQ
ncbi:DUF4142 domain-containing protein [Sorangium sp. So ce260]|uniref:DUF4142 domain-containing protein n=1 Tax=Sorangium sp. So ce260 TaxID=3133291 RepID=UPI003F635CB8